MAIVPGPDPNKPLPKPGAPGESWPQEQEESWSPEREQEKLKRERRQPVLNQVMPVTPDPKKFWPEANPSRCHLL